MERKGLFTHKNICLLAIILIVSVLVYNHFTVKHKVSVIDEIKAEAPASIYKLEQKDTVIGKIRKGEDVQILGYFNKKHSYWVQNSSGIRGLVPVWELGTELIVKNPKTGKEEPVKVVDMSSDYYNYKVSFKDGSTSKIKKKELDLDIKRKFRKHNISHNVGSFYINENDFNRRILGKDLNKIEKRTAPAKYVYMSGGNKIAEFYSIKVVTSKGRKTPVIKFNDNEEAEVARWTKLDGRLLADHLPFGKMIMGSGLLCSLIDETMYDSTEESTGSFILKIPALLLSLVYILLGLVWLFLTPLLPAFSIGYLIYKPHVFKSFSNPALYLTAMAVTIVCVYSWIIALGCWGMTGPVAIISIATAIYCFGFITAPLLDYVPHVRCPKCKNINTIEFEKEEYVKEFTTKESERRKVKDISRKTKKWKVTNYTHYIYKYNTSRNYTSSHTEEHGETTTSTLYDDYELLWKVIVYKHTFKCKCCNHEEYYFPEKYKQLGSTHVGQHIDTTTDRY